MNQLKSTFRSAASVLAAAAVLGSTLVVTVPAVANAAGSCPITVTEAGSTTVYPALVEAQAGFQSATGCSLTIGQQGSGGGLTSLLNQATTGTNIAASSRPLNTTGAESTDLYAWQIGGDAMVIAVQNSSSMSFLTQLTANQVQAIFQGTVSKWSDINSAWPARTIVPRERITSAGSYSDMNRLFSISVGPCTAPASCPGLAATIAATGKPDLQTSEEEADAAINNVDQIVYTSLANLDTFGPAGTGQLKGLSIAGGSSSNYIAPSAASVQNHTYPAPRQLFLVVNKFSVIGTSAATDTSENVKAYDLINYMYSTAGQAAVTSTGFVGQPTTGQAIPDVDVNLDGVVGLNDIGNILGRWGQTSNCNGWIRADVNNDGTVGLNDAGAVLAKWGGAAFVAPN
jgi:ABC-type phosphate transport system substrate-binding protein